MSLFRALFAKLLHDAKARRQFAAYITIGTFVFCVDLSVFQLCLVHIRSLTISSTIAYFTGTTTHFLLNRYANFRNFDRAIHDQARTFIAIIFFQWLVTMLVVNVVASHAPALVGKIAAVVVNLPLGFLAHRYLTFGAGIAPAFASIRRALK